ncbi:MAG: T9SS type A sorting domain-containing protein [Spirosomataceae bacterium]|jgi:hypothetical protein|nr:T9SS type A sorting domain-containing protein [Bacteroidota bacterium]
MKDAITIYLNEKDDKVYVKVPPNGPCHFSLQNLAGKILQEEVHEKELHDFDLTGLPDGIYFVIVNQNENIRSKKIVKGYHP